MEQEAKVMAQTVNPLHVMEDDELVSRLVLAREEGNNEYFLEVRSEIIYRLKRGDISRWTPPQRFSHD